jgi:hypothetical protein
VVLNTITLTSYYYLAEILLNVVLNTITLTSYYYLAEILLNVVLNTITLMKLVTCYFTDYNIFFIIGMFMLDGIDLDRDEPFYQSEDDEDDFNEDSKVFSINKNIIGIFKKL